MIGSIKKSERIVTDQFVLLDITSKNGLLIKLYVEKIELAKSVAELQNGNIYEISEKILNNVSKQNNQ